LSMKTETQDSSNRPVTLDTKSVTQTAFSSPPNTGSQCSRHCVPSQFQPHTSS
jgi:hypothetical protein